MQPYTAGGWRESRMQASTQEVPACPQGPIIMPDIVSFTERLKKKNLIGEGGQLRLYPQRSGS